MTFCDVTKRHFRKKYGQCLKIQKSQVFANYKQSKHKTQNNKFYNRAISDFQNFEFLTLKLKNKGNLK